MRVTDWLRADHRRLRGLLETATRGPAIDLAVYAEFRAGLLRHVAIEEKLLLAAARDARGGAPLPRARDLRVDHAALSSLLVPTPTVSIGHEIALLTSSHDAVEEGPGGVYDECEALLTPERTDALAHLAEAYPTPPVAPHFDGPGVHRTASSAMEAARRMTAPRGRR